MNWFTNIFKRGSVENPATPLSQAYSILADAMSSSGVSVNQKSALGNPAVWRGVSLIANSVAKLPVNVYRRLPDESREVATTHPAYWLLRYAPSDLYSPFTFKQTLIQHALLFGNGYALILRDAQAKPIELVILDPNSTYPVRENGRLLYVTTIDQKNYKLAFADVLHIKGLCAETGLVGWSVIDVMKSALGLGISLQEYGSVFFKNNGKPSVIIELPPNLRDKEKIEQFRNTWGSIHTGLANAHRPALLMAGSKVTQLGGSNEEGQYIQSRQHDLLMVADILSCPPHKLGSGIATSYSSLEAENQAFLSDTLDPWLTCFEEECNRKLLSERQKNLDTHYVEVNRKALIQIDAKTETQLLIDQLNNGLLSWEEARKLMNRPTEKPEGEEWRRPSNIQVEGEETLNTEAVPQNPAAPPEEPQPQEEPQDSQDSDSERLKAMTTMVVNRLKKRLEKSKGDLEGHKQVFEDNLAAWGSRGQQFTDNLFAELEAVLPEQWEAVLARVNPEDIWKDDLAQQK